jgi:hypothetical protein
MAANTAIPITTIQAVRDDVDALGAATGFTEAGFVITGAVALTGAAALTGVATSESANETRVVVVFLATRFAGAFFAVFLTTFLVTAFFAVFFATFFVALFFATAFLAVFFFATAFLAGDFFAAVFFAGDFFAAFFAVFLTATSNSLDCYKRVINAL